MKIFDFGKKNRLSLVDICEDDGDVLIKYWLSGRMLGKYISVEIPRTTQVALYERKWFVWWHKLWMNDKV